MTIQHIAKGIEFGGNLLIASPYARTVWMTLMLLAVIAFNIGMAGDTGEVVYKSF